MEGSLKVLKTMSNEMVQLKNKVVKSSRRYYRPFKKNRPPQSPAQISNQDSDDEDEEDEETAFAQETEE